MFEKTCSNCYQFFDKKIIKYFNDFQITQCYDERELKQWE